jgi:CysZ protein
MARRRDRDEERSGSVGDGISAFFGGIGFVISSPSVWPYAAVPVLMMLFLFCGTFALEVWGTWDLTGRLVNPESTWGEAAVWALRVVSWLVGLLVSFLIALALAQPLSGFALEKIAQKQGQALTGRPGPEPSFLLALWLGLKVALATVFVAVVLLGGLLVIGLLFPPALVVTVPLKVLVTGWLLAWDFVDYPLGLRGYGLRRRLGWVSRHFLAYTTFGLAWALVLLIPGVALLVLPMGVAGATRLVVRGENG